MLQRLNARIEGLRSIIFGPGNTCAWQDNQDAAHTGTIEEFFNRQGTQRANRGGALTLTINAHQLGNQDDLSLIGRPTDLSAMVAYLLGQGLSAAEAATAGAQAVPTG